MPLQCVFISGQLETALGTFYAPIRPLSEGTVLEYRDPISRLARRFFHHLLRSVMSKVINIQTLLLVTSPV